MRKVKTVQELFRRERRPGDLVFAVAFVIFAFFMLWSLPTQAPWSEGARLAGQPALWPRIAVFGMVGFGVLHLLGSLASPRLPGRWAEVVTWLRALEFCGWFVGYVLLLPVIGYLPASLIFGVALTYRLGYRSGRALVSAALLAVVTVTLFRSLLHANVPAGRLYHYLPEGLRAFAQIYL